MDADAPAPPDSDPSVADAPAAGGPQGTGHAAAPSVPGPATAPDHAAPLAAISADPTSAAALDLDAIGADLDGVEAALTRLSDGSYWTDEVTGEPLPDDVLVASPTARRA